MSCQITVFTPTYNRAYILNTLYLSLCRQTYKDFEWLIIDDGSSDGTDELVARWTKENNGFSIRYYRQKNGGKCRAINRALDLAEGELFFTVDSDDYLTDDALEKIARWEDGIPSDGTYCGVAGNLGTEKNKTSNTLFISDYYDGSFLDRYKTIDGERAIAIYTSIHKKYRYPDFSGEKFMTEAVTWNRMANDGYNVRFYNDIICIYEYKEDGLTKAGNKLFIQNPHGYGLCLKEKALFTGSSKLDILKLYYTFTCELSPYYSVETIAECIGTSGLTIRLCQMMHTAINLFRKK